MTEKLSDMSDITCLDCGWTATDTVLADLGGHFSAEGQYADHLRSGSCPRPATRPSNPMPVRLVPVQVFGAEQCCEHNPHGALITPENDGVTDCESQGYGLMDAVQSWSDCNRAVGHIYRFDNCDPQYREPGDTLTIWVDPDEFAAFAAEVFDE